jgi:hypothetical protein
MPSRPITLADFDPQPLIEYAITSADLTNVYLYLRAMQAEMWPGTWEDICLGGYYGASALLHEVVEVRILLSRKPYLLTRSETYIKVFARQMESREAHIRGLEAEYRYLQQIIQRIFGRRIDVGALLRANSRRPGDWQDLFETDLPFFEPTVMEVQEAKSLLTLLRRHTRSEP